MADLNVDIAIIGAGTSGMRAYREATKETQSVLLVEGKHYGTTCARVGCMPSKLLIAAAEAAHHGRHADGFGVHFGEPRIDGKAVMKRVREERDRFVGFVVEAVEAWPQEHRAMAHAEFINDHELKLSDGRTVRAERIVIATGSRPAVPPPFKELGDRVILNDDVFSWQDLPGSVAVFGAGVIGLELGQALTRLGIETTLFGRSCLVGPLTDEEVKASARAIFTAEMEFHPDADVSNMKNTGDAIEITYKTDGAEVAKKFDYVLVATGRTPNVDMLGLASTSIERDERGVPLVDLLTGQTNLPHVFIAGDATNQTPLLHEAADEGFIAGYNAANYPNIRAFSKSAPIGVVFSDPQIMMCGKSHKELTECGFDFVTGSVDWSDQGRSRVMRINAGLLKVYGERGTGKFLGAEMVGPRAEHIAHLLAWAYQSDLTVSEILDRPFYHPAIEEGVRTALRGLNEALQMGATPPPRCLDCGAGG